jgi:hypothetical protein
MRKETKKIIAEYISGKRSEVSIKGNPLLVAIIYESIEASRGLLDALRSFDVDRIKQAILNKKIAIERYEKVTGKEWEL